MKFTDLTIENFLTIGAASLHLDDRGLVLVQGENLDDSSANSNGAGKSTVPDALCWCLFGLTARGEKGDAIINRTAAKNTRVVVRLIDGEDIYEIARHRKHKKGKNSLMVYSLDADGEVITDLSKGTDKATQEVVGKIVGCSYEVFRAAIYAGQDDMPDLPAMTDKSLKLLIEEAAGINVLEDAYRVARERQSEAKDALEAVDLRVTRHNDRLEAYVEELKRANHNRETFEDEREGRVEKQKEAVAELKSALAGANADLKRLTDRYGKPEALKKTIKDVDAKIRALESEKKRERELDDEVRRAEHEASVKKSEAAFIAREARKLREDYDNIEAKIGEPCGECGKLYHEDDLAGARDAQAKALRDAVNRAKLAKEAYEKSAARVTDTRKSLALYRDSMSDPSALVRDRSVIDGQIREIESAARDVERVERRMKDVEERVKELRDQPNPFTDTVKEVRAKAKKAKEHRDQAKGERKDAEKALELAKSAVEVFGPAGVRAHILDTVTPYLNARTAHYLGQLSDGNISAEWSTLTENKKGELREKFQIAVSSTTGGGSFGLISGGEKRKARIACAMALQDLVASRATKPIELWIGDEVDDALDTAGLERLMGVLEERARERGTVLVISHSDLKDWARQVMVVRKKDGYSTISEGE
jgi:DNA repair exonuclease SbcCD ATPase subunit